MTTRKRFTPEEDFERLAERLNTRYGKHIIDRETFDRAFDLYLGTNITKKQDKDLREKTFRRLRFLNPHIKKQSIFRKAGGKDLNKDKKKTAKKVVSNVRDYTHAGKMDLKGYDTKGKATRFTLTGTQKGRSVPARQISTKRGIRFIDAKGRYVSVRRK